MVHMRLNTSCVIQIYNRYGWQDARKDEGVHNTSSMQVGNPYETFMKMKCKSII